VREPTRVEPPQLSNSGSYKLPPDGLSAEPSPLD